MTYIDGDWWPDPVPSNVVVGDRTYLYSSFAFRHYHSSRPVGVRIGDDTGVYEGTSFDLGPHGEVTIGCFGTVVAPIFATNGPVHIGDYAFIAHDVFVADAHVAVPPDARADDDPSPAIVMGDDVWLGTRSVVLAGASLGRGAIVGAGAVVDFAVPDFAIVAGNPARVVGHAPLVTDGTPDAVDDRLRIVVLGYVVGFPLGGMTWHTLHYPLGLADLGHDVWVLEDSDDYESCYDPLTYETGTDPSYGLAYAQRVFSQAGLGERWAYHHAHTTTWHGPAADRILDACASADVVLNLAGIHPLRPWLEEIPCRVFIDADPVFTQIRHLTDPDAMDAAARHTTFFSFGEGIERGTAAVPDDGFAWRATRQPVHLPSWPVVEPRGSRFTTVMQWDSYPERSYDGVRYGMKSESFERYLDLPRRTDAALEVACGKLEPAGRERLSRAGWLVSDPQQATIDPRRYQGFIAASLGEWSVAKHGYVAGRTGWFSERSAAYLATGRPVVLQDTGFSDVLPTGEGLLAFDDPDGAAAALDDVVARYDVHHRAARDIAREHFAADRVLTSLLERALG